MADFVRTAVRDAIAQACYYLIAWWRYDVWQEGIPILCKVGRHKGSEGTDCAKCGLGPL